MTAVMAQPWSEWQLNPTPLPPPPLHGIPQVEWVYAMRRQAQLIIPGLYLGPLQSANNSQHMSQMGITHVLCVRDKRERAMIYPRFPALFKYYELEITDSLDEKIIRLLPDCLKFIDQAITTGGTVLAHCISGINLSPAIVISYIMTKHIWSFERAISFVQGKRYCISPINFENQLKEYEPIYKAIQIYGQNPTRYNGIGKRELEDDDDEEEQERDGKRVIGWSSGTVIEEGDGDINMM